ncbi:MAG: hypothetical protein NVS3B3_04560 [Aquirhabdus sp.]
MTKPTIIASHAIAATAWTPQTTCEVCCREHAGLICTATQECDDQARSSHDFGDTGMDGMDFGGGDDYLDMMQEQANVSNARSRSRYLRSARHNRMY